MELGEGALPDVDRPMDRCEFSAPRYSAPPHVAQLILSSRIPPLTTPASNELNPQHSRISRYDPHRFILLLENCRHAAYVTPNPADGAITKMIWPLIRSV